MNQRAFTLVEVVIAMAILAFLAISVTQSMRRGSDFKQKVQKNIDQRATINSAMRMIERDINLAFHHQDINTEVLKEVEKSKKAAPTPGTPSGSAAPPPVDPNQPAYQGFVIREIPNHTAFVGEKSFMHFTNLNNIPVQGDQKFSDQQEVGYFVKSCRSLDPEFRGDCLWRRSSSILDEEVSEGGEETVLVEGVKRFELRYFGKEKEDWVEKWNSLQGDDVTKDKFPEAVEVTLTIVKDKKEISAIRVVPLRFPNNKEKENRVVQ